MNHSGLRAFGSRLSHSGWRDEAGAASDTTHAGDRPRPPGRGATPATAVLAEGPTGPLLFRLDIGSVSRYGAGGGGL